MDIILNSKDIEWIEAQYPKLNIDLLEKEIVGEIDFTRSYEEYEISDSYKIKIILKTLDGSILPIVSEESSKIIEMAKFYKKKLLDLHINTDGSFCLGMHQLENELFKDGFSIQEFFLNSLEPFLYQMSFYEKEGYFPWGEYAHGHLGILEFYAEGGMDLNTLLLKLNKIELLTAVLSNRQSKCLCGSGEKLRKCHPLIFQGINKIKREFIS